MMEVILVALTIEVMDLGLQLWVTPITKILLTGVRVSIPARIILKTIINLWHQMVYLKEQMITQMTLIQLQIF